MQSEVSFFNHLHSFLRVFNYDWCHSPSPAGEMKETFKRIRITTSVTITHSPTKGTLIIIISTTTAPQGTDSHSNTLDHSETTRLSSLALDTSRITWLQQLTMRIAVNSRHLLVEDPDCPQSCHTYYPQSCCPHCLYSRHPHYLQSCPTLISLPR
jgi:hypothetical protein